MSFRPHTTELHASLSKDERQAHGIFFTPAPLRQRLLDLVDTHQGAAPPTRILEPSCGSGELLLDALARYPAAHVHGVEIHPATFKATAAAARATLSPADLKRLTLTCADAMSVSIPTRVDLILGNPPYFVTERKDPRCVRGRSNIFVLILYRCLTEFLAPGGILAFVLPTSFTNATYYNPCRAYLRDHTTVLAVESVACAGFYETQQEVMLFVVRNTPTAAVPRPFLVEYPAAAVTILSARAAELTAIQSTPGVTSIAALGCRVKTGDVVWNQHKEKLTANPVGAVPVLYSQNLTAAGLVLGDPGRGKQQYIRGFTGAEPSIGPALLIRRGYGNTTYQLVSATVPAGMAFYGENHVNVITGPADAIQRIAASLADARTTAFLEAFVGNGALSKTELEHMVPIWPT